MVFDPRHPVGKGNELRYSDDQPRDDHGRFGATGHLAASREHANKMMEHYQKQKAAEKSGDKVGAMLHYTAAGAHEDASQAHSSAHLYKGKDEITNKAADQFSAKANNATKAAEDHDSTGGAKSNGD